jgi:carboxynorspermidine decarboxylase
MLLPEKLGSIKTPAYVLDERALTHNLEKIAYIRAAAGVKIILATKAFSMFQVFPLMRNYLDGTTASGYYEARLGFEEFGKEVHVYSPAFDDDEVAKIIPLADHVTFNSVGQFRKFYAEIKAQKPSVSLGLRINPELSLVTTSIYDPCVPYSRMGSLKKHVDAETLALMEGLHFHVLCENMEQDTIQLIDFVEENYQDWLRKVKWVNFGGGHFINHPGYDVEKLIARLIDFRANHPELEVILEPGGGIVYDTGYLVASVIDIIENDKQIAILNTSATTHMPDVLELPYRPPLYGSGMPDEKRYNYILAGKTCLTGDVIGEYSFDNPLLIGDKLIFTEMMQYTMVKNTTFNGMPLPDIAILRKNGTYDILKSFGYEDFMGRLGSMLPTP